MGESESHDHDSEDDGTQDSQEEVRLGLGGYEEEVAIAGDWEDRLLLGDVAGVGIQELLQHGRIERKRDLHVRGEPLERAHGALSRCGPF